MREDVLAMAEIGPLTKGNNIPPYIMNGLGVPDGELTLETHLQSPGPSRDRKATWEDRSVL